VFVSGHARVHLRVADEYRSVAHTALKCAAMYDPSLVSDPVTATVRNFARHGGGSWDQLAIIAKQNVSPLASLRQGYGNLFNAVEIYWCRGLQKIIAVVTVLGSIRRSVVIAECECPDAVLCVIEPACQAGAIKNVFLQFDETTEPLPLLEVREFPVTMAAITREFEIFVGNAVTVDSVVATFYSWIKCVIEKHPELQPKVITEIQQLVVEFVQGITRITGRTLS
jgi:hypothetical protein